MCGGVFYQYQGKDIITYFPNPKAALPVLKPSGQIELIPWGRRKEQQGYLPLGGWARLDSLEKGVWNNYFPKHVKLPIHKFMEKDMQNNSYWFDITPGHCLHGVFVQRGEEKRVYVVTITPEMPNAIHERWPRIIVS